MKRVTTKNVNSFHEIIYDHKHNYKPLNKANFICVESMLQIRILFPC